jgi:ABC-type uncharacterized transport system substrate-binding protein
LCARRCAALAILLAAAAAQAHPHVRFSYIVEPVLEADRVTALRVEWIMDPIASWFVLRGLDRNRNGVFEPDELAAFAHGNQAVLAANRYFLTLTRGGEPLDFELPAALQARFDDQRVVLSFAVRLRESVAADGTVPLGVRFFDRTWFVGLDAHDPAPVRGSACGARPVSTSLATEGWGEQVVQEIEITCAAQGLAATCVMQ